MKKTIVVSAINLHEGGPLSILNDCLQYLSDTFSDQYNIIALVHYKNLFTQDNIRYIEFNKSRKSWFFRLYYEYIRFYFLSLHIKPFLWLSLQDITPNVIADVRAVYCHNPSPFYSFSLRLLQYNYKVALFSLFYKYLYRINIRRNKYVIVQQNWIREEFQKMYGIKNVVVAYPYPDTGHLTPVATRNVIRPRFTFFFPAFPRVFKNFEVVADAARLLCSQGRTDFEVLLTIDGKENKYAHHIISKYGDISAISFIGLQSRGDIFRLYQEVNALIFPSKLETWGLPISEFKTYDKAMLIADLPYAHETLGDYRKVKFFNPDDPSQLAEYMNDLIDDSPIFDGNIKADVMYPFAENWQQLFDILLAGNDRTSA